MSDVAEAMAVDEIHRSPNRIDDYRSIAPFRRFSDPDMIAVVDPALIEATFRSDSFRVVDYGGLYRRLSERTGIDLPAIAATFDHIPLAQEGDRHRALRETMAKLFGPAAGRADGSLGAALGERVAQFRPGAEIDVVEHLATPAFDAVYGALLQAGRVRPPGDGSASQVFDAMMSLNRRKRMDLALRDMLGEIARTHLGGAATPEIALALNVLGQDALVGTLTLSLWRDLAASPGKALNEVAFSPVPSSTSVPYIDRVAREDVAIGPLSARKGEVVRLLLDATTVETLGHDGGVLFGKGRHLCLGKPLALMAWRLLTRTVATSALNFQLGDIEIRKADHVFNYPERAVVRLLA